MLSLESDVILVFFIGIALSARSWSGVDKANLITALRVRNYEEASCTALAHQEPTFFSGRVVRIRNCD